MRSRSEQKTEKKVDEHATQLLGVISNACWTFVMTDMTNMTDKGIYEFVHETSLPDLWLCTVLKQTSKWGPENICESFCQPGWLACLTKENSFVGPGLFAFQTVIRTNRRKIFLIPSSLLVLCVHLNISFIGEPHFRITVRQKTKKC